ncbi:MAG: hypothetical protein IKL05_00700 [Clostridia bacterium]|nr:hypothetical protein [Clostridia bacterium]
MNYNFITPNYDLKCDKRAKELVSMLSQRDTVHTVNSPDEICGIEAPVVILPFFIEDDRAASLLEEIPEGSSVFGGHEGQATREVINKKGLVYTNILNEEQFCRENALITAEGAMSLIITATDTTLYSMRVAVLGYGRIGQRLTRMLLAMGATVKVFTSSEEELNLARTRGISACHLWQREKMDIFHAVVNTVPLRHVIDAETLEKLSPSVYILDLASGENNVNWSRMHALSIKGERGSSLPQRISPKSAASAVKNAIFRHLN